MSDKHKTKVKVKDKGEKGVKVKVKAKFDHPAIKGLRAASVPESKSIPMKQVTSDDPTKGLRDALKAKEIQSLTQAVAAASAGN